MGRSAPGYEFIEDDIEIIGMDDLGDRPETQKQNGIQWHAKPGEDSEDEVDAEEEGSRGLLSRQHDWAPNGEQFMKPIGTVWPHVRGIVIESAPTLLLSSISLLFTGKLLDQVSRWRAMQEVDQLIMIIPVVLNLKGNLEMNLSARLGTAANVGELDDPPVRRAMVIGNITLLQVQAILVSFVAACVTLILGLFIPHNESSTIAPSGESSMVPTSNATVLRSLVARHTLGSRRPIPIPHTGGERKSGLPAFIMVASTAITSTSLSGFILGSFMCTLVIMCRTFDRDPDNIAPAVASCLGDLVTLCLMGLVSVIMVPYMNTVIPFFVGLIIVIMAIVCLVFTLRNPYVRPLLKEGWVPLFGAMVISSGSGIILDMFVSRYEGFAILAVVISGLPGAAGSIFVSRLSTALHAAKLSLTSHSGSNRSEPAPRLVMLTLLLVTLPVEVIFLTILHGLGWLNLPFLFIAFSVVFFCCAVFSSLVIAQALTNFLWLRDNDPDMYALPIHSALMDLIGQLLLVFCFEIVSLLGARVGRQP